METKRKFSIFTAALLLAGSLMIFSPALATAGTGGGGGGQPDHCNSEKNCDLIKLYVNPFIRVLSIIVGLVIAASIIMGGIQYSASSGDPQKASAAKTRITNALLAFFAYAFLYAFFNFLIPGGIF